MRILFLNPPHKFRYSRASRWPEHTKSGTLYYPFWLAYAAGLAEKHGHDVLLLDAIARSWSFSETAEQIVKFDPQLLVIETSTPSVHNDINFVKYLKGVKAGVKVVLVGTHPSALPEQTLIMSSAIDFIARREYDWTILDIAAALEGRKSLANVLGISYRNGQKITHNPDRPAAQDIDELPFVSKVYKKFLNFADYRYALARHPMIQILSSRGCPNMCTFCLYPQTFMGRKFRPRSPENFVAELEYIANELPQIKEIFIEDDTFTVDKGRILRICELIKRKNLKIVWSANARSDIPADVLKAMHDAGCRMLIVGYESGSQKILNKIKKGITLRQAERFTADAKAAGIKIFGCFMIGLPGDTKESIKQTFDFAKKLNPDMAFFQQAVPFPGTEFYAWAKQNGYLSTEDYSRWLDGNGQLGFLISYPELTSKDTERFRDRFMLKFYTSPKYLWYTLTHNLNWSELTRLAKGAKDYLAFWLRRGFGK